jgi:hypothetical protein
MAAACPYSLAEAEQKNRGFTSRKPAAYMAGAEINGIESFEFYSEFCAWLDSGASDHMSDKRELFTEYHAFDRPLEIDIAEEGRCVAAIGRGTLTVATVVDGKENHVRFTNVLHVPKLGATLISLGVLEDKGFSFAPGNRGINIFQKGKKVLRANRCGTMYRITFKMLEDQENKTSKAAYKVSQTETAYLGLWHKRLGHINAKQVVATLELQAVLGVSLKQKEMSQCEPCVMIKSTKSPLPGLVKSVAKVCGYSLELLDEYSNHLTAISDRNFLTEIVGLT